VSQHILVVESGCFFKFHSRGGRFPQQPRLGVVSRLALRALEAWPCPQGASVLLDARVASLILCTFRPLLVAQGSLSTSAGATASPRKSTFVPRDQLSTLRLRCEKKIERVARQKHLKTLTAKLAITCSSKVCARRSLRRKC